MSGRRRRRATASAVSTTAATATATAVHIAATGRSYAGNKAATKKNTEEDTFYFHRLE